MSDCYYLETITSTGTVQGTSVSEAELKNGKYCYILNCGHTLNPTWRQTIGGDITFGYTGDIVYKSGTLYCDGSDDVVSFSNADKGLTYGDHSFTDNVCTVCGMGLLEGVYQIGTPTHLVWFSDYVNRGNSSASGTLTADIDMAGINFIPIGLYSDDPGFSSPSYNGTFNGGNHIIKNLTVNLDKPYEAGLFSRCVGSASVKNLGLVNVSITTTAKLNEQGIRAGAIAGLTSIKFSGCYTQNVTINTDNAEKGGIAGVFYTSGANPAKCYTTYETLGTMASGAGPETSFAGSEVEAKGPTGELCWALTDNTFKPTAAWRQNLGTDNYPSRDVSCGFVQYISTAGYATQALGTDVTIPAGMKAYKGKVNGEYLTLTELADGIPANTGVVLEAAPGFYSFTPTTGLAAVEDNDLVGAVEKVTKGNIAGNYILAEKEGVVGFYEATNASALAAGKAYLPAGKVGAGVKCVTFGDPTGIEKVQELNGSNVQNSVIYDLSGRRVQKATKGLYIVNGKKVLF